MPEPSFQPSPRAARALPPRALVIAASTGGPQAIATILSGLDNGIDSIPVFVVLHMPADFASVIVSYFERASGRTARIMTHGAQPENGVIYIAPGNLHASLAKHNDRAIIMLDESSPENFCRPAANKLFRSAARVYGARTLGVVLTGMGNDGLDGSRAIVQEGGVIIAQDKATSAVWGMPAAVIEAGLATEVEPVNRIAASINRRLLGLGAGAAA